MKKKSKIKNQKSKKYFKKGGGNQIRSKYNSSDGRRQINFGIEKKDSYVKRNIQAILQNVLIQEYRNLDNAQKKLKSDNDLKNFLMNPFYKILEKNEIGNKNSQRFKTLINKLIPLLKDVLKISNSANFIPHNQP